MALFCLLVSVCNDGVSPHNQEGLEKETRDACIKLFHLKFKYGVIKTIVYVYNVCEYTD